MPRKPNYGFEKRQKEAAKQKRKAEKLLHKRLKKEGEPEGRVSSEQGSPSPEEP